MLLILLTATESKLKKYDKTYNSFENENKLKKWKRSLKMRALTQTFPLKNQKFIGGSPFRSIGQTKCT